MSNFPTSLDDSITLPIPASNNTQNSPSHSFIHSNEITAIKAIESKIGIGDTAPASNKLLLGTGAGTSAWQQLTSAELRGVLSDETGTGAAVFAISPTLVTPELGVATATSIIATTGIITNLTATTLTVGSQTPSADWTPQSILPSSVVYNGQGSYTETYAQSVKSFKSPGQRNRYTRTVTAPTQSTSLNGTNQYWVKTTPNKMTFTDDFVVDAYIKITSYPAAGNTIASRINGTQGWNFYIEAPGTVVLIGYNASLSNASYVRSYQSVPLNKWVRITAQLDMSAFTATTTTSYVMIDGVDVPAQVLRFGTNPTALVQAGDFEVGAYNGASGPMLGKIAQVAVFNAKVTQAQMRTYHSQGYSGSETSLASAYSFNGVATDLNTTTPNDLTAMNSAGYTTSSPFTTQGDDVPNGTTDYSITQSVSADGLTVVTQVPNGCAIPTSGGVSAISYSGLKSPYGFPSSNTKWQIVSYNLVQYIQGSAVLGTYYNIGNFRINIPIGEWCIGFRTMTGMDRSTVGRTDTTAALSTSSSSISNNLLASGIASGNGLVFTAGYTSAELPITTSSETIYYHIVAATGSVSSSSVYLFGMHSGPYSTGIIYANNNYL